MQIFKKILTLKIFVNENWIKSATPLKISSFEEKFSWNLVFFLEFCSKEGKSSRRLSFFLWFFAWVLVFSAGGVKKNWREHVMPTLSMHYWFINPMPPHDNALCLVSSKEEHFHGPRLNAFIVNRQRWRDIGTTLLYQQCWCMLELCICSVSYFPTNPSHKRAFSAM